MIPRIGIYGPENLGDVLVWVVVGAALVWGVALLVAELVADAPSAQGARDKQGTRTVPGRPTLEAERRAASSPRSAP